MEWVKNNIFNLLGFENLINVLLSQPNPNEQGNKK